MPEKAVGQQTREPMMLPARRLPDCIVGPPQRCLRCLEALGDRPPHAPEPHAQASRGTPRGVAAGVPGPRMGAACPLAEPPHGRRGWPLLAPPEPWAGALGGDGACGPRGHGAALPAGRGDRLGQGGDRARRWGWRRRSPLGALLALIMIGMRGRGQGLEPTPRGGRRRDARDSPPASRAGLPAVWAVPLEPVCHHLLAGERAGAVEVLPQRGGQLGLTLPRPLVWPLPCHPPRLLGVGAPGRRQAQPLVDQHRALPRRIGGKDAHLTVLHLAQRAAILAGHPDGVLPFVRAPRLDR